jgi:uncharacterized membrane protein
MTHLGSGSWSSFRNAVEELSNDTDPDPPQLTRNLRILLSDLGHVDFFIDGARRWQVLRPALLGTACGGAFLFAGGRSRALLKQLSAAAADAGLSLQAASLENGLSRVHIIANPDAAAKVAVALGIDCFPQAAMHVAAQCPALRHAIESAPVFAEPANWTVESWSFADQTWTTGAIADTARRYTSRFGVRRYMVPAGKTRFKELAPREAIHAAALLRGQLIAKYDREAKRLTVPRLAPLPALFARAACLSAGICSRAQASELVFERVAPDVAAIMLTRLGHRYSVPGGPQ